MRKKKGFTLIELIVVISIIGILVLLAVPKFIGHTKEAKFTKFIHDTKQLENASERYYMDTQDWPRLSDTPYTSEQIEAFSQKIYDSTGKEVLLDPSGEYYDIDYNAIQKYIKINDSKEYYILQNPVGNVYALEGLSEKAKNRLSHSQPSPNPEPINNKPLAIITMTPNSNVTTSTDISWASSSSTDSDGDEIVNIEWEGKQDKYDVAGNYTVKLRVQDEHGLWSDWESINFTVALSLANTEVDLSKYNQLLYVDSNMGTDMPGNGSKSMPFKSITYAIDNITIDNTAIIIASGNYNETLKRVLGNYESREYALIRSNINKNYSLIGDKNNPPIINLYTTSSFGYIIQSYSSSTNSPHTYEMYNLIFKVRSDSQSLHGIVSDICSPYKVTINANNIVVDNSNSKVLRIAYFNGGAYGTLNNALTLNIKNSVIQANTIVYLNGNGTINANNSIVNTNDYGASINTMFNSDNSILYPYKYNVSGVYQENPLLDANYQIQNQNQKNLNIGVYSGQFAWGK